jgi:hypothetical protein
MQGNGTNDSLLSALKEKRHAAQDVAREEGQSQSLTSSPEAVNIRRAANGSLTARPASSSAALNDDLEDTMRHRQGTR